VLVPIDTEPAVVVAVKTRPDVTEAPAAFTGVTTIVAAAVELAVLRTATVASVVPTVVVSPAAMSDVTLAAPVDDVRAIAVSGATTVKLHVYEAVCAVPEAVFTDSVTVAEYEPTAVGVHTQRDCPWIRPVVELTIVIVLVPAIVVVGETVLFHEPVLGFPLLLAVVPPLTSAAIEPDPPFARNGRAVFVPAEPPEGTLMLTVIVSRPAASVVTKE
jgi:hypothetical protein